MSETKRINIEIPKDLWHVVGIESAKLGIPKREFVIRALEDKIGKVNEKDVENQVD